MAILSARAIYALCRKYGFSAQAATVGTAIVLAESSGNTNALNVNTDGSRDRGLWQINDHNNPHPPVSDSCATDPTGRCSTRAAKKIYSENGGSFKRWTTYTNGAYKAHMKDAQAAAAGASKPVPTASGGNSAPATSKPQCRGKSPTLGFFHAPCECMARICGGTKDAEGNYLCRESERKSVLEECAGASSDPGFAAGIGEFLGALLQGETWIRVAMVIGGSVLTVIAFKQFAPDVVVRVRKAFA